MKHIKLKQLSVGYGKKVIVQDINIEFLQGKMTCILGSNGAGKTTILKTMANILSKIDGTVELAGKELSRYKQSDLAQEMSVVFSNRVDIAAMTGFDVAAMGRYPHTGFFGILSDGDIRFVNACLEKCSASYLKNTMFDEMSDGEKQKILIARGLSQAPNVLLLDEPTSHLDIRYKLEILSTLKNLCVNEKKTVICTLHEPELAVKCCDYLVLVRDDQLIAHGETDEVVASGALDALYGFDNHQFNAKIGIVEFNAADNKKVFVIGSDENTPTLFRALNRNRIGFAAGVLHKNDVNYHIAATMNVNVITADAYTMITEEQLQVAFAVAQQYESVIMSDFPRCDWNDRNFRLYEMLKETGKTIYDSKQESIQAILTRF